MEATQKVKKATKKTKPVVDDVPVVPVVNTTTDVVVESAPKPELVTESEVASKSSSAPTKEKEIRLTEIPVVDEITALNLMVSFLGLAQKRGAYTIDEASKIWECIKKFQRPTDQN
jgi:hypothetical protein